MTYPTFNFAFFFFYFITLPLWPNSLEQVWVNYLPHEEMHSFTQTLSEIVLFDLSQSVVELTRGWPWTEHWIVLFTTHFDHVMSRPPPSPTHPCCFHQAETEPEAIMNLSFNSPFMCVQPSKKKTSHLASFDTRALSKENFGRLLES